MSLDRVLSMLRLSKHELPLFPPTELYNEGWSIRLVLDWLSTHQVKNHPLNFPEPAKWFSEALLPSQFKPRLQKDSLGESRTHADGAIGHFSIGEQGKADLSLDKNASHLVIIETKMFSKLSQGVTNAKYFNQAARTVACIAEILERANIPSQKIKTGFYILARESNLLRHIQ